MLSKIVMRIPGSNSELLIPSKYVSSDLLPLIGGKRRRQMRSGRPQAIWSFGGDGRGSSRERFTNSLIEKKKKINDPKPYSIFDLYLH